MRGSKADPAEVFLVAVRGDLGGYDSAELLALVARDEGALMAAAGPWGVRIECGGDELDRILASAAKVLRAFHILRLGSMACVLDEYGDAEAASRFRDQADDLAGEDAGSLKECFQVHRC